MNIRMMNGLFKLYANEDGDTLISAKWIAGGIWGTCGGGSNELIPETQPEFESFDELVLKVCPDILHKDYIELKKACCTVETIIEYGYYGSVTYYRQWKCDLYALYEMMKNRLLIND